MVGGSLILAGCGGGESGGGGEETTPAQSTIAAIAPEDTETAAGEGDAEAGAQVFQDAGWAFGRDGTLTPEQIQDVAV